MRPTTTAAPAVLCCLAAALIAAPGAAEEPPLWDGLFADGTRVAAVAITGWNAGASQPQLGGRLIFDAANPVRWVVRQSPPPGEPPPIQPFVELACGDRLPGVVEEHASGVDDWRRAALPHLLVRPLTVVDLPGRPARGHVRVASEQVRRIVLAPRTGPPPAPATILARDGREIGFRSLRFAGRGVLVLGERGTQRLALDEIAEIRMPDHDSWADYARMVAWLAPQAATPEAGGPPVRLTRVETDDGLVATMAVEPLRAMGEAGKQSTWRVLAQPAWSLDPLWLPHAAVRRRLVFAVDEVPLSLIEPASVARQATFGGSWTWRRDRSVQGGPLAAGRLPFGQGFGVQARCELTFSLPDFATAFRGGVALDDAAGAGGCVRASVHEASAAATPLWQGDFLVGSGTAADTGTLPLTPGPGGPRTLVLVADSAHDGRPQGADPHDIRDTVDWLDPVVTLAREGLAGAVRERLAATIAAWRGWDVEGDPSIRTAVDPIAPVDVPGPLRQSLAPGRQTVLRRVIDVSADAAHLVVGVSRTATPPSRVEIRVDGTPVADADVPERKAGAAVPPLALSLARFAGRSVEVHVAHVAGENRCFVEWAALGQTGPLETRWHALVPATAASAGGATLRVLDDGSVLASGASPDTDVHTVEVDTSLERITALRLEAIRDDSLPAGGPGRSVDGTSRLGMVAAEAAPRADPGRMTPLAFSRATASFAQGGHGPEKIIDADPRSGWSIHGLPKGVDAAAILGLAAPAGFAGGTRIRLTLRYEFGSRTVLGRFRLAATTDPEPQFGIPATMLEDKAAAAAAKPAGKQ